MSKRRLTWACLFLISPVLYGQSVLSGRLVIPYPGYDEFSFSRSYIYIEEIDVHVPVDDQGRFVITFEEEGIYTLQPRCPGFLATATLVEVPHRGVFPLEIGLQMIEIKIRVVQEIPAYIVDLKKTMESMEPPPGTVSAGQYTDLVRKATKDSGRQGIDIGRIYEFFRELIEKRRERE